MQIVRRGQALSELRICALKVRNYSSNSDIPKPAQDDMQMSRVPTSQIERMYHFGELAASVGIGMLTNRVKQLSGQSTSDSLLTKSTIDRIVRKLSRMRGAALKIGQLISFQDENVIPVEVREMLVKLQSKANYMPPRQLEKAMITGLGPDWRDKFSFFDERPFASASIGQVHKAAVDGIDCAVKVQFPGVDKSIDSDLNSLSLLLLGSKFLPEGLFLDKTIENARKELKWETDYVREANHATKYSELLKSDRSSDLYSVPKVFSAQSCKNVLCMEFMNGHEISKLPEKYRKQETYNDIATRIMRLCLLEISRFRFMQTDPNWANFLLNTETNKLEILDFGATRSFDDKFIEPYLETLRAGVRKDREACEYYSLKLGYLTGVESKAMRDAHVDSIIILGEPFRSSSYNFSKQTVSTRVRANISLMLRERLTSPPEETYGLHRKLSGAYLLCSRLGATVPCGDLFDEIVGR